MTDQLSLQEIHGLIDVHTPTVHHVVEVNTIDGMSVTTAPQRWAYAVSWTINVPDGFDDGRTLIRIEGFVNSGHVGVGLLRADESAYLQEIFRTPYDGLTCFDLLVDSLADCRAVVIRNASDSGESSKITIQSAKGYRVVRAPATQTIGLGWIETHRDAISIPTVLLRPTEPYVRCETAPKVSLILTVKNGLPYLQEAIDSVRRQEFRDFELVVQDCHSADGSLEYLQEIRDIPVLIESEHDDGIGDAWRRAYARCRGEIIGGIDSDNLLKPDALSTVAATFAVHPTAAAVYGAVEIIDQNGAAQSRFVPAEFDVLHLIACQLVPPWSTSFFSRAVCGANLQFDRSLRVCADYDVWLRISHLPILVTDCVLGCTRLSHKSMTCRIESYDLFCQAKIQALVNYLNSMPDHSLTTGLLRYGVSGIYCWAAESIRRLGAGRQDIERFLGLALQTDPRSDRALRIHAALRPSE